MGLGEICDGSGIDRILDWKAGISMDHKIEFTTEAQRNGERLRIG
jgi:hypothetical protein